MVCVAFSTETLLVMTRSVRCFTLGRGRRAEGDFGQQRLNKPNYVPESVQEVEQTQEGKLTQSELGS